METCPVSQVNFIQTFLDKNITLFTMGDLIKLFNINKPSTLKQLIRRLKQKRVIKSLIRNRYQFLLTSQPPSDFAIANFLVQPSYISLESALSYYSFIDQFPYHITSIALGKPRTIKIVNKEYIYASIKADDYKDICKIDDFLIAVKKKALYDYIYFIFKGLRPAVMLKDLAPFIKKPAVRQYIRTNADPKLISFIQKHVKL